MALQNNHTQTPEQSTDIVNLITDDELQIVYVPRSARRMEPNTTCPICLQGITNTCRTDSCSHKFCFHCLKQWANVSAVCPLCKINFRKIYYESITGYPRTHQVVRTPNVERQVRNHSRQSSDDSPSDWELEDVPERRYEIPELEARRQVYSDNLRAVPLSDMNGVFRTFNSDSFGRNTHNYSILQDFIRREITAITSFIEGYLPYESESIQIDCILSIMMHSIINLQGAIQSTMIEVVLGRLTNIFLNEIFNFIYSPYNNLTDYDRNVEYIPNPNMTDGVDPNLVITLDSDDDSVLEISSRSSSINENSNVENLHDSSSIFESFRNEPTENVLNSTTDDNAKSSTELFNSLGRDQPSTSTDNHSNGYTSKTEKGQQDKIRKNHDSQAKVTTTCRKRPHSESSSLSDVDTD